MKKNSQDTTLSDLQLEKELYRIARKRKRWAVFRNTMLVFLVIAAACVVATGLWFPIYRVSGRSMEPNLQRGQFLVAYRTNELACGDIAVFFSGNQILIKRVIGTAGDVISIDASGCVSRNGQVLNEPYISEPVLGFNDQRYPYCVPDDSYFVMGDHRAESADSRLASIGSISKDQVSGKIILRIWPVRELRLFGWGSAQ